MLKMVLVMFIYRNIILFILFKYVTAADVDVIILNMIKIGKLNILHLFI